MWDMAHSIYLIKLSQITMRKNFRFLFLTALNVLVPIRGFLLYITNDGLLFLIISSAKKKMISISVKRKAI